MIVDSNLIIYSATAAYPGLQRMLQRVLPKISAITHIEVLGYHKLAPQDRHYFEQFFLVIRAYDITPSIINRAVALRQQRKLSLGDSVIAATALEMGEEVYTHNVKDFAWIPGLTIFDPLAAGDPP
jgi:toxin FitB